MPPKNLYGLPRNATKDSNNNTPSSSTLAFTTKLSSLIASSPSHSGQQHPTARPRPRSTLNSNTNDKDDIFARPNRGTAQRAAADEQGGNDRGKKRSALEQVHATDSGVVDEATLERSKRRLREKEGLYDILKEGGHLVYSDDEGDSSGGEGEGEGGNEEERKRRRFLKRLVRKEREGLVDFDAKWASTSRGSSRSSRSSSEDDAEDEEEDDDDENASIISYEDELGRTRRGTRKQAARAAATIASTSTSTTTNHKPHERWKPAQPQNLIHGSTIQTQAFDPDAPTASHMARLAARRDRSATPPEETHYDAAGEVRARGTGFYAFSRDEGVRREQMEELMRGREETERGREERRLGRERRGVKREERRKVVEELRGRRRAEVFLEGLS